MVVASEEDGRRGDERINGFLEQYYGQPAAVLRKRQACYAGPAAGAAAFLQAYADAGAEHLIVRFTGEHDRNLEALAGLRAQRRWSAPPITDAGRLRDRAVSCIRASSEK